VLGKSIYPPDDAIIDDILIPAKYLDGVRRENRKAYHGAGDY
jgi:hypothetical protein